MVSISVPPYLPLQQTNPLTRRHVADILNYALTLEHLEDTFYRQGLANFTEQHFAEAGYNSTFYNNLKTVSTDESTHVSFLTQALTAAGATPVAECTYSFPVTDVQSFLATASVLEGTSPTTTPPPSQALNPSASPFPFAPPTHHPNPLTSPLGVGVSAYLGAAAQILSKTYLTAAASILTVESRHTAYIRASLTPPAGPESPFPQPFDDPLSLNQVYTLASPFIVACPASNPALPVKAFPALTATAESADGKVSAGSSVTLATKPGVNVVTATPGAPVYGAFITVTGAVVVSATMKQVEEGQGAAFEIMVPEGVKGQSYVVLTGCNVTAVTDDVVVAGPAIVEVSSL